MNTLVLGCVRLTQFRLFRNKKKKIKILSWFAEQSNIELKIGLKVSKVMTGARDITQLCCSLNMAGIVTNKIEQSFYSTEYSQSNAP